WKQGGWYHYYFVALLAKLPLGWICLLVLSARWWLKSWALATACVILPAMIFVTVSLKTNMNEHTRYLWLVLPMLAVLPVAGVAQWSKSMQGVALACVLW